MERVWLGFRLPDARLQAETQGYGQKQGDKSFHNKNLLFRKVIEWSC